MAKKKDEFDLDKLLKNGDIDTLFGDDDLDFDKIFSDDVDDSREPVSLKNIGKSTLEKMKEVDADRIKQAIDASIPKKLSTEYDTLKDVYSSTADVLSKQTALITKDVKNLGKKLDKVLPAEGRIRDIFNKFYTREEEYRSKQMSEEERRQAEIINNVNATLGDFSKVQEQATAINNILEDKRTASTNEILKSISSAVQAQKVYHFEYGSKFQRRSLELQYKQAALLQDILSLQKESTQKQHEQLQAIIKHTGLPDIVKQRQVEMFGGDLKAKTRAYFATKMIDQNPMVVRLKKKISTRVKTIANEIRDAISGAEDAVDGYEMSQDMGISMNDAAGSMVRDVADKTILRRVFGSLFDTKGGKWLTNKVRSLFDDPAGHIRDLRGKIKGDGVLQDAGRTLLSELAYLTDNRPNAVRADLTRGDLDGADSFDHRTKITINRIIPGYLRKIHGEVKAARLGYQGSSMADYEESYSHDKDKFISKVAHNNSIRENIQGSLDDNVKYPQDRLKNNIYGRDGARYFKENNMEEISDAEMNTIMQAITRASIATGANGLEFLKSDQLKKALPKRLHGKLENIIKYVQDKSNDKDDPYFYDDMRNSINNIRKAVPSAAKEIEKLFKNGDIEELEAEGLITYDPITRSYKVDDQKLLDYQFRHYNLGDNSIKDDSKDGLWSYRKSKRKWKVRSEKAKRWMASKIPDQMKEDFVSVGKAIDKKVDEVYKQVKKSMVKESAKDYFSSGKQAAGTVAKAGSGFFKKAYETLPVEFRKDLEKDIDSAIAKTDEFYQEVFTSLPPDTQEVISEAINAGRHLDFNDMMRYIIAPIRLGKISLKRLKRKFTYNNLRSLAIDGYKSASSLTKDDVVDGFNKASEIVQEAKAKYSGEGQAAMEALNTINEGIVRQKENFLNKVNDAKEIDILKVYKLLEMLDAAMRTSSPDAIDEAIRSIKRSPEAGHKLITQAMENAQMAKTKMIELAKIEGNVASNEPDPNTKAGRLRRFLGGVWNMIPLSPVLKMPMKMLWEYAKLTWKIEKFLVKKVVWPVLKFGVKAPFKLAWGALTAPMKAMAWAGRKVSGQDHGDASQGLLGRAAGWGWDAISGGAKMMGRLPGMWMRNLSNPFNPVKTLFGGKTSDRSATGKAAKDMGLFAGKKTLINGKEVGPGDKIDNNVKKKDPLVKILLILGAIVTAVHAAGDKIKDLPAKIAAGLGAIFVGKKFLGALGKALGRLGITALVETVKSVGRLLVGGFSMLARWTLAKLAAGAKWAWNKIPSGGKKGLKIAAGLLAGAGGALAVNKLLGGLGFGPDDTFSKAAKDLGGAAAVGSVGSAALAMNSILSLGMPSESENETELKDKDGKKDNKSKKQSDKLNDKTKNVSESKKAELKNKYKASNSKSWFQKGLDYLGDTFNKGKDWVKQKILEPLKSMWSKFTGKIKDGFEKKFKRKLTGKLGIRLIGRTLGFLLKRVVKVVARVGVEIALGGLISGGILSVIFILMEAGIIAYEMWDAGSFLGGLSKYLFGVDFTKDSAVDELMDDGEYRGTLYSQSASSVSEDIANDPNKLIDGVPSEGGTEVLDSDGPIIDMQTASTVTSYETYKKKRDDLINSYTSTSNNRKGQIENVNNRAFLEDSSLSSSDRTNLQAQKMFLERYSGSGTMTQEKSKALNNALEQYGSSFETMLLKEVWDIKEILYRSYRLMAESGIKLNPDTIKYITTKDLSNNKEFNTFQAQSKNVSSQGQSAVSGTRDVMLVPDSVQNLK